MSRVLAFALALLPTLPSLVGGCDERVCARSHVDHRPEHDEVTYMPIFNADGTVGGLIPLFSRVPARDVELCDEWRVVDGSVR